LKQNHFPSTAAELKIKFTTVTTNAEDKDLRDVMREEKSRGKRRVDPKEERKRQELLRAFRDALDARTEREFLEAIKLLGLGDDPQKREKALKIWRSFSR
jgi:DnaJ-domain-containing protein 1